MSGLSEREIASIVDALGRAGADTPEHPDFLVSLRYGLTCYATWTRQGHEMAAVRIGSTRVVTVRFSSPNLSVDEAAAMARLYGYVAAAASSIRACLNTPTEVLE